MSIQVLLNYGTWNAELKHKHSNYKELRNLVNAVESCYESNCLKNTKLFIFNDNFMAECAFYNGGLNKMNEKLVGIH
jgi:hypothetical protein